MGKTFCELLNQYIEEIGCSAKELAETSGLPASVISRYRTGARVPTLASNNLLLLAEGLSKLSGNDPSYSSDVILKNFTDLLELSDFNYEKLAENLNLLIDATKLNINNLARFMNYDTSFISRIRTGQRHPAKPELFIDGICRFASTKLTDKRSNIASLIGKSEEELDDERVFYNELYNWFCSEHSERQNSVNHFLNKLDEFDLNDYIDSIHFNELKIPNISFSLPTSKNYNGITQMRKGELDFFKATVLSNANDPVFMCSDMDVSDMASDLDFGKKWMFAIAMCLKKGLHLNMIHTIDRPFDEMMLGLESWIPIYMTGQISPYYLKNARSSVYQHLNYVSGSAALTGECIAGHHSKGKYYLTKKPDEVAFYREKSDFILSKAYPLMEIYRSENADKFEGFIADDAKKPGVRHGILSSPPIYTITDDLLSQILKRNDLSEMQTKKIFDYVHSARERMESILEENTVFDEVPRLSENEFRDHPVKLSLERMFSDKEIQYSYEEYCKHLEATDLFAKAHENYRVSLNIKHAFRNIQIFIHEDEFALISKDNSPVVHFVIRQSSLRKAIENMVLPII